LSNVYWRNERKSSLEAERGWYEKDEFENEDYDDYDDGIGANEAEHINIDEYLSSDDTPDYKTQTNNYSDDDERITPSISYKSLKI
jgi:hypothetical protein